VRFQTSKKAKFKNKNAFLFFVEVVTHFHLDYKFSFIVPPAEDYIFISVVPPAKAF